MKKRALVILLCLCLCMTLCFFVACGDDEDTTPCTEHTDANNDGICDRCGAKIEKPDTPDNPDKPDNPDQPVTTPVTGITVSTDDEEGDGSIENPFTVRVAQGNQLQLSYAVRPNGATDKTFAWVARERWQRRQRVSLRCRRDVQSRDRDHLRQAGGVRRRNL